jgi:hypothetical protein
MAMMTMMAREASLPRSRLPGQFRSLLHTTLHRLLLLLHRT